MTDKDKEINLKADICHIEFWLLEGDLETALLWLRKLKQDVKNGEVGV